MHTVKTGKSNRITIFKSEEQEAENYDPWEQMETGNARSITASVFLQEALLAAMQREEAQRQGFIELRKQRLTFEVLKWWEFVWWAGFKRRGNYVARKLQKSGCGFLPVFSQLLNWTCSTRNAMRPDKNNYGEVNKF